MTLLRIYSLAGVLAITVASSSLLLLRRGKKSPEQREAQRRAHINAAGRITDGTVLDVQEFASDSDAATQLVHYTYDVAGVQYECSQDVTHLRQFLDLHSCRIGVNTSVKYDPHYPGNSIVVAETWCGLRT
jgi:hypothetical protein